MTECEYAAQLQSLGKKVHFHDGIWWQRVRRGYCRPIWRSRCFSSKTARPSLFEAFLGYSHGTVLEDQNKSPYKVMQRELGRSEKFSIETFSSNRRSKIRRGLKRLDVKLVTDIKPYLSRMMEVASDARKRTGAGQPVEYYQTHGTTWQRTIHTMAGMKDNFFLVALKDDILVAYYHCLIIDKIMSITAAKSHSEYLRDYPNDALAFKSLEYAFNQWGCSSVLFGDYATADTSLNLFKEGYGFQCVKIPQYECLLPGVGLVKRIVSKQR